MSRLVRVIGRVVLVAVLAMVALAGFDMVANAEDAVTSGPTVKLDVARAAPGDPVWMTATGFDTSWVTISVCGNAGRRGSPDCNMPASEGAEIVGSDPLVRQVAVVEPPVPCPCIIRVADRTNSVVATAPIEIVGHPMAEVTEGATQDGVLSVSVHAEPAATTPMGWLRAELGGRSEYEVTVRVHNESSVELQGIRLAGSAGRDATADLLQLEFDDPGTLAAGQTWEQTVHAVAPAPSFSDIEWRVFVSGDGPTVAARQITTRSPALLTVLVIVLLFIVATLLVRMRVRVHQRRAA